MDGFNGILDIGKEEEVKMIIDKKNRWKGIVNRFAGILNKLIREGKDSKKIKQILLHWCYELTLS